MIIAGGEPRASAQHTGERRTGTGPRDRMREGRDGEASDDGACAPRLLEQHLLGVARMGVIALDGHGRITHWNHAASDLFGLDRERAVGRSLTTLLRVPQEHRAAFEPGGFGHVWCGGCFVPRVDDGELAEVAWWVYPIDRDIDREIDGDGGPGRSPSAIRVLAVAADLRRLRDEGPGLGMGDVLMVSPADGPLPAVTGLRLLRVEPTLVPITERDASRLGRRLAELLPLMGPAATEHVTARVLAMGYPAVNLSVTVRLPVVPYWGGMPRALRLRPRAAVPNGPRHDAGHVPATLRPRPREGLETMAVRERFTFLGEAGEQIGSSLDHLQAARKLAEVMVPRLADYAVVELLERVASAEIDHPSGPVAEDAPLRRIAVVHDDEPGRWADTLPEGEITRIPSDTPCLRVLETGLGVHIPRVTPERAAEICASYTDRDLRPLITGRALLILPLVARGQVLGLCKLMRRPGRPGYDELDLTMIEELVRRAALCVDNGRLYRREAQAVQRLQRSMLPDDPPEVPGARVCFRYRPAGQAAQVGGDWFDAIPLPGCRLGIVVGDVMGHGLTSAAIMGQLRTAVRTLAAQDLRPDQLLHQLDALTRRLGEDYLATCLYAVYDPVARTCQLANAGHLPPVLVSAGGDSRVLPVPSGVPIGVGGEPFETVEVPVEDGAQLVLCTDGLVERRDRDIDQGMEALRGQLAGAAPSLERTCDAVLETLGPAVPVDDIALVAVGCDGVPPEDVAVWPDLPAKPSMVRQARAQAAGQLARWGLSDLSDTVELLVSELVTNALVHGAGQIGMRLIRGGALLCEVSDDGHELPHLCRAGNTDESGRGLQLVSVLATRWGTHRTDRGKVVWFEHALPREPSRCQ
ncbi:SpoIIE family protein phosphatase [Actinomadura namibiensis]|uniref:protein-serine/threonine phosphatase n=1 Tax=Actinomadura namibiensis TaxID=182080 RepID=A0A7W3LYP5_ACTNM|nr:SpoIIE family protein phosphatase [Actinomadura namibiensis]MBA8956672.1 PAS domain S-box-containing protein [Actinomadura namibiensis]